MPDPFSKIIDVSDDLAEVGRIQAELESLWTEWGLPQEMEMPVSLALEEVLSNVLRHGRAENGSKEIRVSFAANESGFGFEVSDRTQPYNPLERQDPDLALPLEQRRPGGLGVYLVKQLADEVSYERRDERNHLRFWKRFDQTIRS